MLIGMAPGQPAMNDNCLRLTRILGTELPIIQAPMAGVQGAELTIAVSAAGALGSLPAAMLGSETLNEAMRTIAAQTNRPYNVNFFCHDEPRAEPADLQRWQLALAPYYTEFGIEPAPTAAGPARTPFNAAAAACVEARRPAVVSFHFGLPSKTLLARVRASGARVLATATSVAEARWLEQRGVDAIIAQGLEAGGHRGLFLDDDLSTQVGTLALVGQLVDAVRVPVIAAGGIAGAAEVAAALALGAAGVQVGTAYLLCAEATTSAVHRAALVSPQAGHTAVTNVFSGRPARGIVNRIMRELGPMSAVAPPFPLATAALAPLRAHAEARGSSDFSPLWSGQNVRGLRAVPAAELTRDLGAVFR